MVNCAVDSTSGMIMEAVGDGNQKPAHFQFILTNLRPRQACCLFDTRKTCWRRFEEKADKESLTSRTGCPVLTVLAKSSV